MGRRLPVRFRKSRLPLTLPWFRWAALRPERSGQRRFPGHRTPTAPRAPSGSRRTGPAARPPRPWPPPGPAADRCRSGCRSRRPGDGCCHDGCRTDPGRRTRVRPGWRAAALRAPTAAHSRTGRGHPCLVGLITVTTGMWVFTRCDAREDESGIFLRISREVRAQRFDCGRYGDLMEYEAPTDTGDSGATLRCWSRVFLGNGDRVELLPIDCGPAPHGDHAREPANHRTGHQQRDPA